MRALPDNVAVLGFRCPHVGCMCVSNQDHNVRRHTCYYGKCLLRAMLLHEGCILTLGWMFGMAVQFLQMSRIPKANAQDWVGVHTMNTINAL